MRKTKKQKEVALPKGKYIQATGRRKTSVAIVRIFPEEQKQFLVNKKPLQVYFQIPEHQRVAQEALDKAGAGVSFGVSVMVRGGGLNAQAEAVRHGLARALVIWNPELRALFKKFGYLKRDPRMRERKKFGLKRARRARQWRKR